MKSFSVGDARHLMPSTLQELWETGVRMVIPVKGEPACQIRLDPGNHLMTLVTKYARPEPDVSHFKNLTFVPVSAEGDELAEIIVKVDDNVHGAYGLLVAIMDGLQIEDMHLANAVAAGIARNRDVFAARGAMTTEREVGLLGELLFLEFLIDCIGAGLAIASWQGPFSEEHDFTLPSVHLEVKTTSGEQRRHVIHGLGQLVPLQGIPLNVVSIQVTRTAPEGGRTLPQAISRIRQNAGGHRHVFDAIIAGFGWRDGDEDLYSSYWTLRSRPRAYRVEGDFPAMTPDLVAQNVPNFGLISDVSYRIDLTSFEHVKLPAPLDGFVDCKDM